MYTVQPATQPVPLSEHGQHQAAAVSSKPPPQPAVVSSGTLGQQTSDAVLPEIVAGNTVAAEKPLAAAETAQVASSPSLQLKSSKRSTQRPTKSSHKSTSVSDGFHIEVESANSDFSY